MENTGMSDRRRIIRDGAQYLTATIVSQGVGLARAVLLPVLFNPAQLGIWNLLNVVLGYGSNAHLGLLDGMNKSIPSLRGQNELAEAERIKDSVFWANLMLGGSSGVALVLASWYIPGDFGNSLRILGGVTFLQLVFYYLFSLLRADNRFGLISSGVVGLSVLSTILVLGGAVGHPDRLRGGLLGLLASYGLIVAYWLYRSRYRFVFQCRVEEIRTALKLGFPLIVLGVLNMVFMSVDRWMIAAWLDETRLGYYALGFMASNLLVLVPTSVASVLYPRMLERFAVSGDPRAARGLMVGPLRALAVLMLILIGAAIVFLPPLIRLFLPKYLPSTPVLMMLIPGVFFLSLAPIAGCYLIAINRQRLIMAALVIISALCLAGDYAALNNGYGIIGVAVVTAVGYSILGLSYILMAVIHSEDQKRKAFLFMIRIFFPFAVMIVVLAAMEWLIPIGGAHGTGAVSTVVRMVLLMIVLGPSFWLTNRDGELTEFVRLEWKHRFGTG
jgi:O-antigen/teichoic acid export membrane protein